MRIQRLINAICKATEMNDNDKAKLSMELCTISEKQFLELEAVYMYGMY